MLGDPRQAGDDATALKDAGRSIQVTDAMRSAGASAMFRLLPVFEGGDPLEEVAGKVFYEMWLAFVEEERKPESR